MTSSFLFLRALVKQGKECLCRGRSRQEPLHVSEKWVTRRCVKISMEQLTFPVIPFPNTNTAQNVLPHSLGQKGAWIFFYPTSHCTFPICFFTSFVLHAFISLSFHTQKLHSQPWLAILTPHTHSYTLHTCLHTWRTHCSSDRSSFPKGWAVTMPGEKNLYLLQWEMKQVTRS